MSTYTQIASKIIKEQETLMGSVAWSEASKVLGLTVDEVTSNVSIEAGQNESSVIDGLVQRYENLFGLAAKKVCKESVVALLADLPENQVPVSLQ